MPPTYKKVCKYLAQEYLEMNMITSIESVDNWSKNTAQVCP